MSINFYRLQTALFFLLLLGVPACRGGDPAQKAGHFVLPLYSREIARVGSYSIKEDDLRFRLSLELDKFPRSFVEEHKNQPVTAENPLRTVLDRVLSKVIEDHVILAYGAQNKTEMTAEELKIAFENKKQGISPKELDSLLAEKKIPFRRWKQMVENELRVQFVLDRVLSDKIKVSVAEVQQYYGAHRDEFAVAEQVRARHIVTDSQAKSEEIYQRLKNGENFAKLAVNHSLSPDRSRGGDLGYFARGTFPKEFDETCFYLEKGEISPIVKSDYGYHIFKLIDKKPAGVKDLKQVAAGIHQKLFEQKLAKQFEEWMTVVKKRVKVQIFEENLKDFVL